MELELYRDIYTKKSTIGKLYVEGEYWCETLEDRFRESGNKIPKETCIPEGEYEIVINHSPSHGHDMPYLLNVPKFTSIMIHSGNTNVDTEGCILVGNNRIPDMILNSRVTFERLFAKLLFARDSGEKTFIRITHGTRED